MISIFIFFLLVLALGFGFAWFADRPGDVVLQWQGNQYETSLMVVVVAVVALVITVMVLWWLARTVLDSPKIMQRFFSARKQDRGYRALSQGLIAANSGDAVAARRYTKESAKLLGREPLVNLLDAQSTLLEGKREVAQKQFESMLGDESTRLVALRGLYLEAERQGQKDAARHYAEEANKNSPALPWAGNAKLRYACLDRNWEAALASLEANRSAGLVDKDTAKRHRAVLLTAQAEVEERADPVKAAKLAREAHKLAPDLVPAAIIGAKALARNNDIGRAAGMIETVWKRFPHPELATAYVHLRMGDSALDRLKRARKIANLKSGSFEGNFAIAEAAIDCQEWKTARKAMKPVLTSRLTERACLVMADIEEGEFGDKGRMRDWLSRRSKGCRMDGRWLCI
jgi:HemY protein